MVETCKNCGNRFRGAYCNRCGQKIARRLDLGHILHEAVHVFTHTDRGIFALIPALLFRSGLVAREYVQGRRKHYFSIFQYLVIIVGIATFAISQSHVFDQAAGSLQAAATANPASQPLAVQKKITATAQQYFNLFLFVSTPIFSLFSWLYFKSKHYNYAEHFVLQAALQGQLHTYFLLVIFPLLFWLGFKKPEVIIVVAATILAGCNTLANHQFFRVSWHQAFFKGFLISISTNLVQLLIIIVTIVAIIKW